MTVFGSEITNLKRANISELTVKMSCDNTVGRHHGEHQAIRAIPFLGICSETHAPVYVNEKPGIIVKGVISDFLRQVDNDHALGIILEVVVELDKMQQIAGCPIRTAFICFSDGDVVQGVVGKVEQSADSGLGIVDALDGIGHLFHDFALLRQFQ